MKSSSVSPPSERGSISRKELRVAEALEGLPETAGELRTGAISFSHARELTRVATPCTEKEWLEVARGRTVREVEHLVRGHRPGSLPHDVPEPDLKRQVLHLELSGEVMATFREAMAKIRRDAGESLDDDAAILLLCRQVLEGPKDPGRSSYQIALTVCDSCRRAKQQGRGELIEVGPEIVETAECDGQHVGHLDVYDDDSARAHVNANAHVGVFSDDNAHEGAIVVRATQSIPPALRRTVLRRDGGKCRVPGCNHSVFTDAHHIERRCEGGQHDIDNIVTLCAAHHVAVHEGRLIITGSASSVLYFTHADGTPYGGAVRPALADARAKAF